MEPCYSTARGGAGSTSRNPRICARGCSGAARRCPPLSRRAQPGFERVLCRVPLLRAPRPAGAEPLSHGTAPPPRAQSGASPRPVPAAPPEGTVREGGGLGTANTAGNGGAPPSPSRPGSPARPCPSLPWLPGRSSALPRGRGGGGPGLLSCSAGSVSAVPPDRGCRGRPRPQSRRYQATGGGPARPGPRAGAPGERPRLKAPPQPGPPCLWGRGHCGDSADTVGTVRTLWGWEKGGSQRGHDGVAVGIALRVGTCSPRGDGDS